MTFEDLMRSFDKAKLDNLEDPNAKMFSDAAGLHAALAALRDEAKNYVTAIGVRGMLDKILAGNRAEFRADGLVALSETAPIPQSVVDNLKAAFKLPSTDFAAHLARQREFSERTFGPGERLEGVSDHIRKELLEVAKAEPGHDRQREWIDVVMLALDGAWRSGMSPDEIIAGLRFKLDVNERRTWPDWRTADPNKAIEHDKAKDGAR